MFIIAACYAQNEQMAVFMRAMAQLMGFYNERVESIRAFIKADSLPLLEKVDGTVVAILPLDYLAWTQRSANKEKSIGGYPKDPGDQGEGTPGYRYRRLKSKKGAGDGWVDDTGKVCSKDFAGDHDKERG